MSCWLLFSCHTDTHTAQRSSQFGICSPWSMFECRLFAYREAEASRLWMSAFLYFSWQLPHLDRGTGGLPAELQQTQGPSQSTHHATAPGTMFHTSALVLVCVSQTAWGKFCWIYHWSLKLSRCQCYQQLSLFILLCKLNANVSLTERSR